MKIRWNLEIQINLICLDEATRTRADDQNPERRKNPVLLPNRSKTPGHSFRFNLFKDFFLVDPTTSRAVRTTNNGAGYNYIY